MANGNICTLYYLTSLLLHSINVNRFCSMLQSTIFFPADELSSHPSNKALVNVSKISLKTFIVLATFVYNFVHFNQESWKSTCKVVIESFRNRSYQFLISEKKLVRSHTHVKMSKSFPGYKQWLICIMMNYLHSSHSLKFNEITLKSLSFFNITLTSLNS